MGQQVTVGFDIGGTNLRGAAVDKWGVVTDTEHLPTPSSAEALYSGICTIVERLACRHDVAAVGVAIAGFLDTECATVRFAPHLPWRDAPVKEILGERLGLPVRLEHDANAAAWGEYRFGAARGAETWVLFAIGTGIGGALMIGGNLYRGAYGTAPEFGHITVVRDGRPCPCGKKGCLERYCSGTALVATAREMIAACSSGKSTLVDEFRGKPDQLTGRAVVAAARRGDPVARAAVDDFAGWLGTGLAMVADICDPELIVIGGGVASSAPMYLDRARSVFADTVTGASHRPLATVRTAELSGDAGMIGVADLARRLI